LIHKLIARRPRDIEDARQLMRKNPSANRGFVGFWLREHERELGTDCEKRWDALYEVVQQISSPRDGSRHVYRTPAEFRETDVGRFHRWLSLIVLGLALGVHLKRRHDPCICGNAVTDRRAPGGMPPVNQRNWEMLSWRQEYVTKGACFGD